MAKKIKGLLRKKEFLFIPATQEDVELLKYVMDGDTIQFVIGDNRELWRHRRFFLLLNKVLHHIPEELEKRYPTTNALLIELKLQLRMYDVHVTLGGKEMLIPQSISFANMGEKAFIQFCNDCKKVILKYFLKGIDEETFDKEFFDIIMKNG